MKRIIIMTLTAAFAIASASAQFVPSTGNGWGARNGSGNQGNGPKDGTGYGAKSGKRNGNGTGTCDQTGPKGSGQRGGGGAGRGGRR